MEKLLILKKRRVTSPTIAMEEKIMLSLKQKFKLLQEKPNNTPMPLESFLTTCSTSFQKVNPKLTSDQKSQLPTIKQSQLVPSFCSKTEPK